MPNSPQSKAPFRLNLNLGWLLSLLVAFQIGRYSRQNDLGSCGRCASSQLRPSLTEVRVATPQQEKREDAPSSLKKVDDGWHSIDVFYGNTSHLDATPCPVAFRGRTPQPAQDWYGQVQQDRLVIELLGGKTNGYFLDLAANDARTLSNTFALERHYNWTGLCIEPNPQYWPHLAYRKCQVVAAVVGRYRMEEVHFRFPRGVNAVLGGVVDDKFDIKTTKDASQYTEPPTPKFTVPLLEILQRYNAPNEIDYLSLDAEGAEEYIMSVFPLDTYHIKVMTIERPSSGLELILKQNGFQMVQKITRWGETLWAHESFLASRSEEG